MQVSALLPPKRAQAKWSCLSRSPEVSLWLPFGALIMDGQESWRVEALLKLYEKQMEHFQHTQSIEWKGNFGLWTALGGAIYVVTKSHYVVSHQWWAIIILVVFIVPVGLHLWWLSKVHASEDYDKIFWSRYRAEALQAIRGSAYQLYRDEWPYPGREKWQKKRWLAVEVGVTLLLCALLFYSVWTVSGCRKKCSPSPRTVGVLSANWCGKITRSERGGPTGLIVKR
jgi:hypothetical protein